MDISRKTLIIAMVIDIVLLAAGIVCMVLLNFNTLSLCLFAAIAVCILVTSILVWHYGKNFKK